MSLRARTSGLRGVWDLAKKIQVRKEAEGWGVQDHLKLGQDRYVSSGSSNEANRKTANVAASISRYGSSLGKSELGLSSPGTQGQVRGSTGFTAYA